MNKLLILGVELGSEGWGRHLGVEYHLAVLKNFWRASELFRWLRQVRVSVWNSGESSGIDRAHSVFSF